MSSSESDKLDTLMQNLKGIAILGWLHPRNMDGIFFLHHELKIPILTTSKEHIHQLNGTWLVLAPDFTMPYIPGSDKLILCGPHFYPHQIPKQPEYEKGIIIINMLSQWVKNLCEKVTPITNTVIITAPFPLNYYVYQPLVSCRSA